MDERGPLHAWRDGVTRFADGLPLPGRSRAHRIDPAMAVSSTCDHEWLPSPIGPAEYCGRCGAMRRRQADGEMAAAKPTQAAVVAGATGPAIAAPKVGPIAARKVGPIAARKVGPPSWPDGEAMPAAIVGSMAASDGAAEGANGAGAGDGLAEVPGAAPRPVSPRITRPAPFATPIVVAAAGTSTAPVEHQRSFIRTATLAAVLLSFGALIGFVGADLSRDAREGRGIIAAAPTATAEGRTAVPSVRPSTSPEITPAPSASGAPATTPPPVIGPALAPPVTTLGGRLTASGIELDLAWQPPADGAKVSRYDLQAARDGGAYRPVRLASKTSRGATVAGVADHAYSFQVRARAADGTPGAFAASAVRLSRVEESGSAVRASKGWKVAKHPDYTGAGARYATSAGAELSLAFDGTGVAIVGPRGPGRGEPTSSSMASASVASTPRRIPSGLSSCSWRSIRCHPDPDVLTIRVAGTPGRPMVAIDRFLVLSQP